MLAKHDFLIESMIYKNSGKRIPLLGNLANYISPKLNRKVIFWRNLFYEIKHNSEHPKKE